MICVLQFDAAGVGLLDRMLERGDLPALAAAIEDGRRLELESPAEDFAAGAFYTLYSGAPLADHGIFYPFQWSAAAQRARYATAFEAPPPVWERLAGTGLRTLAIDPYESRPPQRADGVLVCGWGFSDRVVLPRWSRPRLTGARLAARHGRGPGATEVFGAPRARDLLRLRERLLAAPARIAALAREQLAGGRFDLAWLTFSASHLGGHAFWDLSQLEGAEIGERERATLGGALEEIYRAVDKAIGDVLEALPDDADVLITSAVGMDVNTSRADLLPEMLAAVLSGGPLEREDPDSAGAIWRLREAMPVSARRRVAELIPRPLALELTARLELRGYDWGATPAFAHPADNQGYVRLNLRGRERHGVVAPGPEAEALLARIAEGLADFRLPGGEGAVASVLRSTERYRGEREGRLPDLVVRWSERVTVRAEELHSERFGRVARRGAGSGRSGNHTPGDAWAVLRSGASRPATPDRPRLEDVAATVCESLGLEEERRRGIAGRPLLARPA